MVDDGSYTAVLDRIEADAEDRPLAVLLLEADGEQVGDLVVPVGALPANARQADAVLAVDVVNGELANAEYRSEETERRAEDAQSRLDRLSRTADEER